LKNILFSKCANCGISILYDTNPDVFCFKCQEIELQKLENVKYPKLQFDQLKSVKIKTVEREKIRKLHNIGINYYRLSKIYLVGWATIKKICDDKFRIECNAKVFKIWQRKYQNDPEYRKSELLRKKIMNKELRTTDRFKEWKPKADRRKYLRKKTK